jgi:DNA-binding transcriptional LysR family regulator
MELRQLRYFVRLSETGSFARTAESEGVTQSAVSQQIARLEREWKVRLFRRTSKGAELTPAGRRLLRQANALVEGMSKLADHAVSVARETPGRLRLGLPAVGVSAQMISSVLGTYGERFPAVEVNTTTAWTLALIDLVAQGDLDAAFSLSDTTLFGVRSMLMLEAPAAMLVPENHPLAGCEEIGFEDLAGTAVLIYSPELDAALSHRLANPLLQAGATVSGMGESAPRAIIDQVRARSALFPAIPWELEGISAAELAGVVVRPCAEDTALRYGLWLLSATSAEPIVDALWDVASALAPDALAPEG